MTHADLIYTAFMAVRSAGAVTSNSSTSSIPDIQISTSGIYTVLLLPMRCLQWNSNYKMDSRLAAHDRFLIVDETDVYL